MPARRSSRRRRASVSVACVVGLVAVAACSSDDKGSSTTPSAVATTAAATTTTDVRPVALTLGLLTPPTGLLTDAGTAQRRGVQAAIDDINGGGGIGGAQVTIADVPQQLGAAASSALPALSAAGVNAFIGPVSSGDATNVMPALAGAKLVACSASATEPGLTSLPSADLFFRTAMPDQYLMSRLVTEINNRLTPEQGVTIVARDDAYGAAIGGGLENSLVALARPATLLTYPAAATSFGDLPQRVAATKPSLVVMVTLAEGPGLLAGIIGAGVSPSKILGLDGMFDPRLATRAFTDDPSKADGVSIIATTGGRALLDRMITADPTAPLLYLSQAYDCATSLALAAAAAGSNDPAAIAAKLGEVTGGGVKCTTFADCLSKLKAGEDIDYDGPSGPIGFDAQGDPSGGRFTLARISSGRLTEVSTEDVSLTKNALIDAYETSVASAVLTTTVQQQLTLLGFYTGPIDGVWDDDVKAAVAAFQTSAGLPATGALDEATVAALDARVGTGVAKLSDSTIALQTELTALGFYTGPIDGRYSAEVVAAVKALQASVGAPQTGVLDADTMRAVFAKGIASVPTTTTPPSTEAPTTTVKPTTTPPPTEAPTTPAPTPAPTVAPTEAPTTEKATTTTVQATTTTVKPTTTTAAPITLLAGLTANGQFTGLVQLIDLAGVQAQFNASGPSTVFAPTDTALTPSVLAKLKTDPALASKLLGLLVPGKALHVADLVAGTLATTGGSVTIALGPATVNGVPITRADLVAGASLIQGVDALPIVAA